MSLSIDAKRKLLNINKHTNLPGFYQFENKIQALQVINSFEYYIKENGLFTKNRFDASCDPNFQHLSAAIDYYKFGIKRKLNPLIKNK